MPSQYSWSCKRSYKNGYVWNDLTDNDIIYPSEGAEYILKGSEIIDRPTTETNHNNNNLKQQQQQQLKLQHSSPLSSTPPPPPPLDPQPLPLPEEQEEEEDEELLDEEKSISYTSSNTPGLYEEAVPLEEYWNKLKKSEHRARLQQNNEHKDLQHCAFSKQFLVRCIPLSAHHKFLQFDFDLILIAIWIIMLVYTLIARFSLH